jgi:hypothetical protein
MMKGLTLIAAVAAGSLALVAQSSPLAFWHFNDTTDIGTTLHRINPLGDPDNMTSYASDLGSLSARISTWGGGVTDGTLFGTNGVAAGSTANNFGSFVGTTEGDMGFGAGGSLSIIGTANNDNYFTIAFDDAVANLTLSYWTRGTGTGFDTHTIRYSTDGGQTINPYVVLPANQTATWSETVVDFGALFAATSGLDANVIYITVSGASGTSGNNRFDNIALLPAPGALALLGIAGLIGTRRRR